MIWHSVRTETELNVPREVLLLEDLRFRGGEDRNRGFLGYCPRSVVTG
jgi:hypothetical protein